MKKIAFISWDMTILGGINQVVVTLANEFVKYYDVHIISLIRGNGHAEPQLDSRVHEIFFVQEKECRGREVVSGGREKLNSYLKKNEIDILFLMGFQVGLPTILMTGRRRCKLVFCEHEALMSRWHERKITLVRFLAAFLSNKIVTLTEQNAIDYRKMFHFPTKKVAYIYNSINENVLKERHEQYDTTSKTILSVGRFSPEKQYNILLDVAQPVLNKHPDWKWVIYGTGEMFEEVENEIQVRGMRDKVILKGETRNVASVYKQGAIFVLTSCREGLPLVLLEAKANHLPCVSFDIVSGPNEIIRDKKDGFLIQPFNIDDMIKSIEELIVNESLRAQMAAEADGNLDKFSMHEIMKQWSKLIETL